MYSKKYKLYVTVLLMTVYVFNQVDRAVFGFLMQPIKLEFGFSDSELGFLAGPALVLLYALLGVPVARLADRSSRVNIISVAVALWSSIVTLSAMVAAFWQFALARVGVGIGEAGFSAVAQSLITDYHTDSERGRAMSIFMLALPLGGVISSLLAGWVNEAYGWRMAFVAAGLPGLVLAVLIKVTVKEPLRQSAPAAMDVQSSRPSLRLVFATLWQCRSLRYLAAAMALVNTVCSCVLIWMPTFFIRSHSMATGELGTWFAVILGIGGGVGVWLGGYMSSHPRLSDERTQVRTMAVTTALIAPVVVAALWCPSKELALAIFIPAQALLFFFYAPTFSLVQGLCAAGMRATMASVFILIQVLAGGAVGVQLIGVLSDLIAPWAGDSASALRWSMTLTCLLALWAAVYFWRTGRSVVDDLRSRDASIDTAPAVKDSPCATGAG